MYEQKWQQIGLSVKLTQTTADRNVLRQDIEASASSLVTVAFSVRVLGMQQEEQQRSQMIFFEGV